MSCYDSLANKKLIQAFVQLMEEKKYSLITISDICRKAGVSRMAFYRGFSSKEGIAEKFIGGIAEKLHEKLASAKEFNIKNYFSELFGEIGKYGELIVSSAKSNIDSIILRTLDSQMSVTFNKTKDEARGYRGHFMAGAVFNVLFNWILNGQKESPEEMADICCSIVYSI